MTRNFAYDPQLALRQCSRLNCAYDPYTYVWPKFAQATLIESDPSVPALLNWFIVRPVQHFDSIRRHLATSTEKASVVIPQWRNTSWYATAIRACFEYEVLLSTNARDTNPTPWAMLACHFLHRYDDKQKNCEVDTNMSNDKQSQYEETSTPERRKRQTLAHPSKRVSRASHLTVNPTTLPPHRYDASRDREGGDSQRWQLTPGKRYAHACCPPTAEPRLTAPRPHGRDASGRSER